MEINKKITTDLLWALHSLVDTISKNFKFYLLQREMKLVTLFMICMRVTQFIIKSMYVYTGMGMFTELVTISYAYSKELLKFRRRENRYIIYLNKIYFSLIHRLLRQTKVWLILVNWNILYNCSNELFFIL